MNLKDWKFCPRCAAPGRLLGKEGDIHFKCPDCSYTKYDNPLPAAIGLIERHGKVLLLRRALDPEFGKWDAVGGFMTGSETAQECLIRECLEEISCLAHSLSLIGTFTSVYGSTGLQVLSIAFTCALHDDAQIQLSDENLEYGWFSYGDLPTIAFADVRAALALRRIHA